MRWKWPIGVLIGLAFCGAAAAQSPPTMNCNLRTSRMTIQASDTDAAVSDLLLTCSGGPVNTATQTPIPTADITINMPQPITSPIISTSGGTVSDALLFIDDAISAAPGATSPPGFGPHAAPTLCTYSASSTQGCPAYPNLVGGVPVMTSAPNPLGSPNPDPPAANVYQGVVNGKFVTFFGVPLLPSGTTGVRTYRITNIRVNAAAGSASSVVGSIGLHFPGPGSTPIVLYQTMVTMATTQSGNTVLSARYDASTVARVAPGQIVNLSVQGVGVKGVAESAMKFPLPTDLAGISVTLTQTLGLSGSSQSFPVPILSVTSRGAYTMIEVQIPFEMSTATPNHTALVVSENGVAGDAFPIIPVPDQVHALSFCDLYGDPNSTCGISRPPIITHANGVQVDLGNPAKIGEELVMYVLGLGVTTPPAPTGQATSSPAPVARPVQLNFDYRPNATPSRTLTLPAICTTTPACPQVQPVYVGLTPGFAGLYQVNFIVPPPPPGTLVCNAYSFDPTSPSAIASNLTVSIIASASSDGAGICVDTSGS